MVNRTNCSQFLSPEGSFGFVDTGLNPLSDVIKTSQHPDSQCELFCSIIKMFTENMVTGVQPVHT